MPVATAYTAVDMFADAHFGARGDLIAVDDPVIGAGPPAGAVPALQSGEPSPAPTGAPRLGADTDTVLADLGLGRGELDALRADGVI